jgi:hypothetical protein
VQRVSVQRYQVAFGFGFRTKFANGFTVDGHAPSDDKRFGFSA